ncbi:protein DETOXIFICATION 14-like [Senna tora]|uniref:Protein DETOXIFICATION n=1 Tax=Senna tora TaxID=362788 RepID=A0A834SQP0_9FABA|nr:protein DETOXIFICATION 14-like [Senna tora]
MEKGLLEKEDTEVVEKRDNNGGFNLGIRWVVFSQEVKDVGSIAAPMVAVNWSTFFLQTISLMMVGHLGKLAQSSTAIAMSLCSVSGFSVIFGLSCALETLCGQANGAKQYRKFGVQIHTGIFSLILSCLPLCLLWLNLGKLLVFLGQDPLIAHEAGKFAVCMIPALFGYATLQALIRYYLMQRLITPLVTSSLFTIAFHIALCWTLVFKSSLGRFGAAFAIGASYWLNVILLGLYMTFSASCAKTRVPVSLELFHGIGEFFRFAIPSLVTLLSGFLPNPELETSILSICVQTTETIYTIPESIGSSASTRVSNALGAGKPEVARVAAFTAMVLSASEALVVSSIIFASRHVLGYVFSNEQDVVDYVTEVAPLLVLSVFVDSLHGTLSGIVRGSGWQHIGAYVNLGSYYGLGIPIAALLGFWLRFRAKGLWIGIMIGAFCQTILLIIIITCTNWEKQARLVRERISKGRLSVENGLI